METRIPNLHPPPPLAEEEPEVLSSGLGQAACPFDWRILAIFFERAPLGPGEYTKESDFMARL